MDRVGPDRLQVRLPGEKAMTSRGIAATGIDCGGRCRIAVHAPDRAALCALVREAGPEALTVPTGTFERLDRPLAPVPGR